VTSASRKELKMPFSTKHMTFPVEILTPSEVRKLMMACSTRAATGVRDRAMIATLYRGGLRINEALELRPKDVDLETGEVRVLFAKGGKSRTVAVDSEVTALIAKWMKKRAAWGIADPQAPLFCTLGGAKVYREQVTRKLKRLAAKCGIAKRVHPHGLRHARAVDLMKNGAPVPVIQRAYGHASLATTATYLNHIAPTDVCDAMRKGAW
jgi:site-specific recombinase XerD